ncbi:MAG: sigma-54-dependent Fis family transcriptional regulator [Polyangiaceae bacterium]|nr:sigma-54-dependent Fis family transcriptional regulator [Polyangiaceae bacterium]MCB9605866.1 sigma-54-dependent Fis family transcriptional regulator [Polyangiaceae bacterium]
MSEARLRVLVVDDEPAMREVLSARIGAWGHSVEVAASGAEALALVTGFDPHVVISDLVLPDTTGIELLPELCPTHSQRQALIITAYGTIDRAVDAMKNGAIDFLTKPLDYVALKSRLEEARQSQLGQRLTPPGEAVPSPFTRLVGSSTAQTALLGMMQSVAATNATVLIVGESGTGKELVARALHEESGRNGEFVAVNAAAIPSGLTEGELMGHAKGAFTGASEDRPGLFEQAHKGSLFLDEITEMPVALQAKLLRVIEHGSVRRLGGRHEIDCDVRIVAATNRDPQSAVDAGLLRADLYYRLNVVRLDVPPLRERQSDIPLLVQHFIRECNRRHAAQVTGISERALLALVEYDFPGNVRELKNLIERGVLLTRNGLLDLPALGPLSRTQQSLPRGIVLPGRVTSAEAERILILETLKQTGNNKAEAARRLGVDVKTIRNKLKTFEPPDPIA